MRLSSIVSEAARNVASGTARPGTFSMALGLLVAATGAADALSVRAAIDAALNYQSAAASVYVVESTGGIDGYACLVKSEAPDVSAAAAVRGSPPIRLDVLPGRNLSTLESAGSLVEVLSGVTDDRGGLVIPRQFAEELDIGARSYAVESGLDHVDFTVFDYPSDGRDQRFAATVFAPVTADGAFDQCLIRIWPQSERLAVSMLSVARPGASSISMSQFNPTLGEAFEVERVYDERVTRLASPLAAIGGALLASTWILLRRRELKLSRSLGVSSGDLALQVALEAATITVSAVPLVSLAVVVFVGTSVAHPSVMWAAGRCIAAGAGAWILAGAIGALLLRVANLEEAVRYE